MPQDAIVECGVEVSSAYATYMSYEPVDIESCDVFDYTSDDNRAAYPTRAGKTFIKLSAN